MQVFFYFLFFCALEANVYHVQRLIQLVHDLRYQCQCVPGIDWDSVKGTEEHNREADTDVSVDPTLRDLS